MRVPVEVYHMRMRKLLMIAAAVIIIAPFIIRVIPENMLAIAGYTIEDRKLVKNTCSCGEI